MITLLEFSADQEAALAAVRAWRDSDPGGDRQSFTLGGYAGTGKTTLIAHLAQTWEGVAVAALCGKAAHVLRAKGVAATTIHGLIYVRAPAPGGATRFRRRRSLGGVRTLIIDEASMIDHVLFHDLLSFGLPVLFVGDHGQLEPIGTSAGLMADPHVRLETIHRQARGNPILRLATAFREGRPTPYWDDPRGRLRVLGRGEFDRLVCPGVQIICGFNKTRHRVNARVRGMLGLGRELVAPGEKPICLKNNRTWNLFNGQQVTVLDIAQDRPDTIHLDVETDDGRSLTLPALRQQLGHDLVKDFRSQDVALMDYGYCLTAHKAQGAEWDEVLVLEEICSSWDPRRWRYTAATRARQRLVYCR
jgi:exodeoxyribonuclease-5